MEKREVGGLADVKGGLERGGILTAAARGCPIGSKISIPCIDHYPIE